VCCPALNSQGRPSYKSEYEGAGVSGGDGDERGKLGRLDRKTGTGGGKGAGVSHGIYFRFRIVSFFVFSIVSYLIFLSFIDRYRRRGAWEYREEVAGMSGGSRGGRVS